MVVVLRVAFAAVFAVAGIAKLRDLTGTRRAAREFGAPGVLVPAVAVLLPFAELATAFALVPEATADAGAAAALALLALFVVAIGVNLARGRQPDCNCFGQLHSAPAGWGTIARNLVLAAGGAAILGAQEHEVAGAYAAAVLVVGGTVVFGVERWRASDDWDEPMSAGGLPIGSPAPSFDLPSLDGGRMTLDSLTDRGRPVLLVFSDPHCGPCSELAPKLARWQPAHDDELTIAILERGGERTRAPDKYGRRDALRQRESEVADAYRAVGTPTAVLVDTEARIASEVAAGAPAIEKLVAANVRRFKPEERPRADKWSPPWRAGQELLGRREALIRLGAASGTVGLAVTLPELATGRSGFAARKKRRRQCRTSRECPGALDCISGRCRCPEPNLRPCDNNNTCTDFSLDSENCGGCGKICANEAECVDGRCVAGNANCDPLCDRFEVCCSTPALGARCVDIAFDEGNCGGCGIKCGPNQTCCEGHCRDIASSGDRCVLDGCGLPKQCRKGQVCVRIGRWQAECRDKCPPGLRRCGGTCGDPRTQSCCSAKLYDKEEFNSDDHNCGKCGHDCTRITAAVNPRCCSGTCVDLGVNPNNCGSCGHKCPTNCVCQSVNGNGVCKPGAPAVVCS